MRRAPDGGGSLWGHNIIRILIQPKEEIYERHKALGMLTNVSKYSKPIRKNVGKKYFGNNSEIYKTRRTIPKISNKDVVSKDTVISKNKS